MLLLVRFFVFAVFIRHYFTRDFIPVGLFEIQKLITDEVARVCGSEIQHLLSCVDSF